MLQVIRFIFSELAIALVWPKDVLTDEAMQLIDRCAVLLPIVGVHIQHKALVREHLAGFKSADR